MCVLEFNSCGWPRHLHHDQDEWIYVVEGEWSWRSARSGSASAPAKPSSSRARSRTCGRPSSAAGQIINVYQPAGNMEEFFQALAKFEDLPTREDAINKTYTDEQKNGMKRLFEAHGMVLTGLPLVVE